MRLVDGTLIRTPREQLAAMRHEQVAHERLAAISTKTAHRQHHTHCACDWRVAADKLEATL
jgi:hypothetical protein